MKSTNTLLQYAMLSEAVAPTLINEKNNNLMYIGYCTPDCKSMSEPKWLIKEVRTVVVSEATGETLQTIMYANGSRRYNQKWTEREILNYKISEEA